MLPSGTVTFLFSDIEGSTQLLQAIGVSRYEDALQQHRRLLRAAFERHSGHEFGTEGGAHFVAFDRAADAVRAASDAQRALAIHAWAEGERVRVRIGLHTCEATVTGSNYVDLGAHRLKDFGEPQRLYQLAGADVPREFPPLRTPEERRTNLPARLPPLFGRESALLERYLGHARAELGAEGAAAWDEGRRTPFDQAIVLALGTDSSATSRATADWPRVAAGAQPWPMSSHRPLFSERNRNGDLDFPHATPPWPTPA